MDTARLSDDGVATITRLRAAGLPEATIHSRVRSGRWQRVLPGIIVLHSGPPTRRQWCRAALDYGGPATALSHYTAAELHGLRVRRARRVQITVPHGRTRASTDAVLVHQCRNRSAAVLRDGLPCTNVARTVVDIACTMTKRDDVRALVSDSVQRRLTTVRALVHAAETAPRHGRGFLNAALEEVTAGARSAGEARFVSLMRRSRLPMPEFNARVRVGRRNYTVDALWLCIRLVVEIDGAKWHLNAPSWESDLIRQNALQAAGFIVLRFPYSRVVHDPAGVIQDIRRTLDRLSAT